MRSGFPSRLLSAPSFAGRPRLAGRPQGLPVGPKACRSAPRLAGRPQGLPVCSAHALRAHSWLWPPVAVEGCGCNDRGSSALG